MISESKVQADIRLANAQDRAGILWRNNSGALKDERGRLIRFGLGNDSAAVNKTHKSSDLIGITAVTITPDMVGQTLGVFTAIEVKASNWTIMDTRAKAQLRWMELVRAWGGRCGFARSVEEARKVWK